MERTCNFVVTYHVPGEKGTQKVSVSDTGTIRPQSLGKELGLIVRKAKHSWHVTVRPSKWLVVDSCQATLTLEVSHADSIFLNGYQGWTACRERKPSARMWGLERMFKRTVRTTNIDAAGDYRFFGGDTRAGHQHGYTYGYLRTKDHVQLFGSTNETAGLTLISERAHSNRIILSKECPTPALHPGTQVELMSFCVVEGTLEGCVRRYLKIARIPQRFAPGLVGATTSRHEPRLSYSLIEKNVVSAAKLLSQHDLGDCAPTFEVGPGWCKVGDWIKPDSARFPEGMSQVADLIHSCGMMCGLWFAPFVAEYDSDTFLNHPDWVLRTLDGEPVRISNEWSGAVALDTQNPEVRAYVRSCFKQMVAWGFGHIYCDYLFAACMVPHAGKNRGQLIADAARLLREAAGDGIYLTFGGSPLGAAFGVADYARISPDTSVGWDTGFTAKLRELERPSTKNAVATIAGRNHLDNRAFRCTPAPFSLSDSKLSAEQLTSLINATVKSGAFIIQDDPSTWSEQQLARYADVLDAFVSANNFNAKPQRPAAN